MNHHRPDRLRIPRAERLRRKTRLLVTLWNKWEEFAQDRMERCPDLFQQEIDECAWKSWEAHKNNPQGIYAPRYDTSAHWFIETWRNNP